MKKSGIFRHVISSLAIGFAAALLPVGASASIVYNTWTTNDGSTGNYILIVTENAGDLDFDLTVNPWNAEALGLFVDLGDIDLTFGATLSSVVPTGQVSIFAIDTSSDNCGSGCNLNGLDPFIPAPDGQWELVFRLGSQGFNGIQTFNFSVDAANIALSESMLGLVGVRAQQLCSGTDTLPDGSCGGSDKSYGTPTTGTVPVPGSLALAGLGFLVGVGRLWQRRRFNRQD